MQMAFIAGSACTGPIPPFASEPGSEGLFVIAHKCRDFSCGRASYRCQVKVSKCWRLEPATGWIPVLEGDIRCLDCNRRPERSEARR